jgi:F1F0 ATPase subunit 2
MTNFDLNASVAELSMAAFAGALLGSLYFAGLWFTVRQAPKWRYPGLGVVISLLLRLTMFAVFLYLFADGQWQRYVAVVPGFLAARWWWIRHINPAVRSSR